MKILLTGGAGYIGSNTAYKFIEKNFDVTIIDNLSTGNKELIPKKTNFIHSDISDKKKIEKILVKKKFDIVVHFAAFTRVGESVQSPNKYFENNYSKTKIFFDLCLENGVKNFIFSSTGSVYGNVDKKNILENHKTLPINPYSKSKLMVENYLQSLHKKNSIKTYILRYFNVAGADYLLRSGLTSNPDNLIKAICEFVTGTRKELIVNGNNFKTKDGTTIRDYIHVADLADMHYVASKSLVASKKNECEIFNCGYGVGYSILEVIKKTEQIIGKKINYKIGPPRIGDASISVANSNKFKKKFNWSPKNNDLKIILKSALDWEKHYFKKTMGV